MALRSKRRHLAGTVPVEHPNSMLNFMFGSGQDVDSLEEFNAFKALNSATNKQANRWLHNNKLIALAKKKT